MHSGLAKEYGQCLLKVISKGVENSKKFIANGILVFFEFCSSLISYTYFIGFNMT